MGPRYMPSAANAKPLCGCVLAGRVGGMKTNSALFSMNYEFRWDDVPNVFCNDISCEEIEFSYAIGPAGAGLRPAYVAITRGLEDC